MFQQTQNNVPSSFAGNRQPWHRVFKQMSPEAATDYRVAMKEGGIDFEVKKVQMPHPFAHEFPDGKAPELNNYGTFRLDTFQELGQVKKDYEVIQNAVAFNFMEELADEGLKIDSCGSLDNGAIVFFNVLTSEGELMPGNPVKRYLQAVSSHNGRFNLDFFSSELEIWCRNTLRHAMKAAKEHFKISHTKNYEARLRSAKSFLQLVGKEQADFDDKLRFLATKRTTKEMTDLYLDLLLGKATEKDDNLRKYNMRKAILDAPNNSDRVHGIGGTLFALLEQTTWDADNSPVKLLKNEGTLRAQEKETKRAISASFGSLAERKTRAVDILLDLAKTA